MTKEGGDKDNSSVNCHNPKGVYTTQKNKIKQIDGSTRRRTETESYTLLLNRLTPKETQTG